MRKVLSDMIEGFIYNHKETFTGQVIGNNNYQFKTLNNKHPLIIFVSILLVEFFVLLLGKYLWNNVIVNLVSVVKPADNIWQLLGLSILLKLLTN